LAASGTVSVLVYDIRSRTNVAIQGTQARGAYVEVGGVDDADGEDLRRCAQ
jgi:hypothetical protein